MKKSILFLSILIIVHFTLYINICSAQWEQCNGIYTGHVNSLAVSGNKVFAGTNSYGVHYSSDYGTTWTQTALNNLSVKSLIITGNNIFAGTVASGVYQSSNNGINWSWAGLNMSVWSLAVSGSTIFAGTNYGVYTTSNNGANWTYSGLNGMGAILSFAFSGSNIIVGANGSGIHLSSNNGINWIQTGMTSGGVFSLAVHEGYIFAGRYLNNNCGVYFSSDNGMNWIKTSCPVDNNDETIRSILSNGSNILAGSVIDAYPNLWGRVFLSTNNGTSWSVIYENTISYKRSCVLSLAVSGSNILAGTVIGIYRTSNNGRDWNRIGLNVENINSFTSSGKYIFVGCNGIYRSSDNGTNWNWLDSSNTGILSTASNDLYIFAGTGTDPMFNQSSSILSSSNNGINWWTCFYSPFWGREFRCLAAKGSNVLAPYQWGIMFSSNNGNNWINTNWNYSIVTCLEKNESYIFAGTNGDGVFFTTNNGTNWSQTMLNNRSVRSLAVNGSNIFAGTDSFGVYFSTNNGTNWTQTSLNNLTIHSLAVIGSNVFAGTVSINTNTGIYFSTNNGNNWIQRNEGFNNIPTINALLIANGYIFAGTNGQSVWRRPLTELITGIQPVNNNIPDKYYLYQNYPNPFNPSTKIRFEIPDVHLLRGQGSGIVTLKVFDILGKEVAVLVNEKLQSGTYEVTFDGSNLPSGVYFYRLTTNNFSATNKLILLK